MRIHPNSPFPPKPDLPLSLLALTVIPEGRTNEKKRRYSVGRFSNDFEATSYFRLGACVGLDNCLCGHFNAWQILKVTSSQIRAENVSHKHGLLGGFGKTEREDLSHENQRESR